MTTAIPFATDQPIQSSDDDRFSRTSFSSRVAHTLAHRSDLGSIVVGIYGAWGEGKTSVLRLIEEHLALEANVKTFWFNPWRYKGEDALLEQFFRSMAGSLGASLSSKPEELGGLLKRYRKILTPAAMLGGGLVTSLAGVPQSIADHVVPTAERISALADVLADVDADTLKRRIDDILSASKTRVVVFLDDIDRLAHQEIRDIFRLVKLTLSFQNTSFVLAFDEDIVLEALEPQYGTAGREFLEKIIQVPLQLPRIDASILRGFCFAAVENALKLSEISLNEEEIRRFVQAFDSSLLVRLRTPRMARRYANTLMFSLPLLKGEVDTIDLLLIEGLRTFYPDIYAAVRRNRNLYLWSLGDHVSRNDKDLRARKKRAIESSLEGLDDDERIAAISLIGVLFPRNAGLLSDRNTSYSNDSVDKWSRDKRVASRDYFDRYFGYGIPVDDISDIAFGDFLGGLLNVKRDDVDAALARLCAGGRAARFLEKVRLAASHLDGVIAGQVAIAIAACSDFFSGPGNGLTDANDDAAIRIFSLLQRAAAVDRLPLALQAVRLAQHPKFAMKIAHWLRVHGDGEERLLTAEEEHQLRVSAVARVSEVAKGSPIWKTFERDTASILYEWMSVAGKKETSDYLLTIFARQAGQVLAFMEAMLTDMKSMLTGQRTRRAFTVDNYKMVSEVVDAEAVAEILRGLGFVPEAGDQFEEPVGPPEEQTAKRFLAIHADAVAASQGSAQSPEPRES